MGSGIANGEGFGAAAAGSTPGTTAATVVVLTATALAPAAFMKFLREYSIFRPPYSGHDSVDQFQSKLDMPWTARADNGIGHVRCAAGTAELRHFRIEAYGAAVLGGWSGGEIRTVEEIKEFHAELGS